MRAGIPGASTSPPPATAHPSSLVSSGTTPTQTHNTSFPSPPLLLLLLPSHPNLRTISPRGGVYCRTVTLASARSLRDATKGSLSWYLSVE
jgi:hypothetical protein